MAGGFTKRGGRGGARGGGKFAKRRASPDDDDTPRASKRSKAEEEEKPFVPALQKDSNGDDFIPLKANDTRRVTIQEFKGNTMISIREYYEADGEKRPGKKGISLTTDQYNALLASAPLIESVLKKRKEDVVRPNYDGEAVAAPAVQGDEEVEEDVPITKKEEEDEEDEDQPINKADDEYED